MLETVNWPATIERNRAVLLRIVVALVATAGAGYRRGGDLRLRLERAGNGERGAGAGGGGTAEPVRLPY